jgi:glycosyltransferase involved in cell wall biosynthesis
MSKPRVIVVMPAYNAARTIERTVADISREVVDEILVVDDASRDDTVPIAQRLGLRVLVHRRNRGYGANQKTCYTEALSRGADIVVMVHADHQYDPTRIPQLIAPIQNNTADMMLGTRMADGKALEGGMPIWKFISNRFLTTLENVVLRQNLSDCHTGFRAYSRRLLETVPWFLNSDDFVFDTQMIVQAVACGFRLGETPVPARYFDEASSVNFRVSVRYGLRTLQTLWAYKAQSTPQFQPATATQWQEWGKLYQTQVDVK